MKCVVCKQGETKIGTATVTLEREGTLVVVKGVPSQVCSNCGEEYVDETISVQLLRQAELAAAAGVQVDVRNFSSAA